MIRAERYTAEGAVVVGPVLVHGFSVSGNGAAASASFYDGPTSNSREMLTLRAASGETESIILPKPIFCPDGLTVKPSASTSETTVFFE